MAREDHRKTAEGEYVVLHDQISYADPEHQPLPGQAQNLLYANRGTVLGGDEFHAPTVGEVKRLMALGAISDNKDTLEAKLALSGARPDSKMSSPYISLSSPAEQERAAKAAAMSGGASPSTSKRDLARLSLGDLKVMAHAYGKGPIAESDDKEEIINALKGEDDAATSAEDAATLRQVRDEAQVSAREVSHEGGNLGSNVTGQGVNAETGAKTELPEHLAGEGNEGGEGTIEARDGGSGSGSGGRRRSRRQAAETSE